MNRFFLAILATIFALTGCDASSLSDETVLQGQQSPKSDATTGVDTSSVKEVDVVPSCVPDCAGKACGADGCGGQCGSCGNTQFCNSQTWTCETPPLQTVDVDAGDTADSSNATTDAVAPATTDVVTGETDVVAASDSTPPSTDVSAQSDMSATADTEVGTDAIAAETDVVSVTDVEVATDVATTSDIETGTDATTSTTDAQAPDATMLKPMTCTLTSLSKLNFKFHGGGVSSFELAKNSWSFPMLSENHQVVFSTGDLPYVAFNMNLGDKWGYGADYSNGGFVLNGSWSLDCEGLVFQLNQTHFNTATCEKEMSGGPGWCVLSEGNDHRIVIRLW